MRIKRRATMVHETNSFIKVNAQSISRGYIVVGGNIIRDIPPRPLRRRNQITLRPYQVDSPKEDHSRCSATNSRVAHVVTLRLGSNWTCIEIFS
ncbi:hypothetical protein Nepgr_010632 [Nepenthes gracilis]|uniref:Uncharacterized protein n=1 Tax=Nepenthes gracilis TaxID=150966 RepID=A0AAD3SDT1_NEPGR|nr:hypothetical protein Nepgr_010632 [Nepenthes gracilis]